jgi:hypothetical protein
MYVRWGVVEDTNVPMLVQDQKISTWRMQMFRVL